MRHSEDGSIRRRERGHVRTALFVDFDNIYSNLRSIDPAASEAFATEPDRWLRWMQEDMGQVVPHAPEGTGRQILVRNCYLNPVMFGKFRPFFTRAAFRVVDCPPLTSRGKNSADIHIVLDIVDTLSHATYFDEFILLSADADFTPVILRLRAHDRRTVLLATGPSAMALQSACDMVLPLEVFLEEALDVSLRPPGAPQPVIAPQKAATGSAANGLSQPAPQPPGEMLSVRDDKDMEQLRQLMHEQLLSIVAAAQAPVPMAAAAQRIRERLGNAVLESSWGGYGGFGKFVGTVTSDTLRVTGPHPPGYLMNPQRHEPLEPEEPRVPLPASIADLAHRVARIVGVPQLTPDAYKTLFEELARLSEEGSVSESMNAAELRVRDACAARKVRVPRSAVHFVLQGFYFSGFDWRSVGQEAGTLADAFADNVLRLCLNSRMELTEDETAKLRSWIAGSR
jgi:NYN domain